MKTNPLSMGNFVGGNSNNVPSINPETWITTEEYKSLVDSALDFVSSDIQNYDEYREQMPSSGNITVSGLPEDLTSSKISSVLKKLHESDHNDMAA